MGLIHSDYASEHVRCALTQCLCLSWFAMHGSKLRMACTENLASSHGAAEILLVQPVESTPFTPSDVLLVLILLRAGSSGLLQAMNNPSL